MASYNSSTQQYDYTNEAESYIMGLWLIFTTFLHDLNPSDQNFIQHMISIRSALLSAQIKDSSTKLESGPFYGWTSDLNGGKTL